jgi:hypothetical protein
MDSSFHSYFLALCVLAFSLTFTHMGTTLLAVIAGWARNAWRARGRIKTQQSLEQWWKEVRSGITVTLVGWLLLFLYCCFEAGYQTFHATIGENRRLAAQLGELKDYAEHRADYDRRLKWAEGETRHWQYAYERSARGESHPDRKLSPEEEGTLYDALTRLAKDARNKDFISIKMGSVQDREARALAWQLFNIFQMRAHWHVPIDSKFTKKQIEALNANAQIGITIFSDDMSRGQFLQFTLRDANLDAQVSPIPSSEPGLKGSILWIGYKQFSQ